MSFTDYAQSLIDQRDLDVEQRLHDKSLKLEPQEALMLRPTCDAFNELETAVRQRTGLARTEASSPRVSESAQRTGS